MRRILFVLCCAATTLSAQQSRAMIGLAGWKNRFPVEDVAIPFTLDASKEKSFAALKTAYEDLNLTPDVNDAALGIVGVQLVKVSTTFAGLRMSRAFDCGAGSMGAQNADSYRLSVVFLTLVDAQDARHTKLRIGVVASGVAAGGSPSSAVQCSSTGALEAKLVELATAHLK
jgi:hypothetical protein